MNEIAEEIRALIELKREASRGQFPIEIKVGYFNKWSKVEKAFSRSEWQQNLKDLIIARCTARIAELENKRKNLLTFKKEENVNKCK